MLTVRRLSKFRRDYKRCSKRGYAMKRLHGTIETLILERNLEPRYRDHSLSGEYKDCRECHVEPDWLLIYLLTETELVLVRTGTQMEKTLGCSPGKDCAAVAIRGATSGGLGAPRLAHAQNYAAAAGGLFSLFTCFTSFDFWLAALFL